MAKTKNNGAGTKTTKGIDAATGKAGDAGANAVRPGRFAHLHLHSEYSLLDGGNKLSRLVDRVKELGMDAVAVTDHGNLYGAVEFYTKAKAAGVKPILGIEAYVAPVDRTDKSPGSVADGGFHLVLLAENLAGWRNLLRLSSDSYLTGFYYKPRMDKATLAEWNEGLIAINGHLGSSIAHHLVEYVKTNDRKHYEAALDEARWHAKTFGPNDNGEPRFYIELQRHGVQLQQQINPHLEAIAKELDLPIVCDNDAHFLRAEDWDAHDSLCCISMQKTKHDADRLLYDRALYVKSPEEMHAEFGHDHAEALANTIRIAERCDVELDFHANHAPVVRIVSDFDRMPADHDEALEVIAGFECEHPAGSTEWFKAFCSKFDLEPFDAEQAQDLSADDLKRDCDGALRLLSEAGAIWRYGPDGVDDEKRARMDRELQILADKLISAYFLIVWDFVNWARQRGIPANARGSGVGTMVGYVLGLSNACPVEYGLLFERFTDPDRTEYPDIDIDICQDGRADVINYVREKYGYVAQIITFGRLKAKQAIKDVARVNGLPPAEGQRLANLVPAELNITIDAALEKDPDLRKEYDENPAAKAVIDTARQLEDHARHAGIHAAGVVVATQPLDNIVPLCKASGSDDAVTQWDGPTCEKVGLLKMDFLGLRTLSTIEMAKRLIQETLSEEAIWTAIGKRPPSGKTEEPHPLDMDRLAYDDQRVLELFRRGDTAGIFQFESGGMRKLLLDMQPDRLEDLIAANALFRPGPMDLIPDYCARKHGRQRVPTVHDIVDGYTDETYGIMVYQEQVMQIVHGLGDIPLRQAYTLIKAISKKKEAVINENRPRFIEGAMAKGLSKKQADELFDLILKFAGYGFNKSHSTGYAIIAYQTAYLKTYFPAQYMAAVLSYESSAKKIDDWAPYLRDCAETRFPDHTDQRPHIGVEVKPPDLNLSRSDFAVVFEDGEPADNLHGHIRFGLGAVRNVSKPAVAQIIAERDAHGPFTSIFDFCERVSSRIANKATIDGLIKCGAFDSLHGRERRSAVLASLDDAMRAGAQAAEDRRAGQMSIFGGGDDDGGFGAGDGGAGAGAAKVDPPLAHVEPWDQLTMLAYEKEMMGIHISGHPLDEYAEPLRQFATVNTVSANDCPNERPVVIGGLLSRVRITVAKSGKSAGQKMAMITLQDREGSLDGVVFSGVFARDAHVLQDGACVLLAGRIDTSRGGTQIIVDRVMSFEDAPKYCATAIELRLPPAASADDQRIASQMELIAGELQRIRACNVPGEGTSAAHVRLVLEAAGRRIVLDCRKHVVTADAMTIKRLRSLMGEDGAVRVIGGVIPVSERRGGGNRWGNGNGGGGNGNGYSNGNGAGNANGANNAGGRMAGAMRK